MSDIKKPSNYTELNSEEFEYDGGMSDNAKGILAGAIIIGSVAASAALLYGGTHFLHKYKMDKFELSNGPSFHRIYPLKHELPRHLASCISLYVGGGVVAIGGGVASGLLLSDIILKE